MKRLAAGLAATVLAATGLLAVPATAQAETHGPCGLHYADGNALYTNCVYAAVVITVDKWFSSDYTICIDAKRPDRYLGSQYGDNHVQGVKDVHYLDGTYCNW